MYQQKTFKATGISALLMHNGHLANPLNKFAIEMKQITGKKSKTEADLAALSKIEWYGGLYTDKGHLCLPATVIEATFVKAALKNKMGNQAKAGFYCAENPPLLLPGMSTKGTVDIDALWLKEEFRLVNNAKIGRQTIMRTRPKFDEWAVQFICHFDDELLNPSQVGEIWKLAGAQIGFGDWRPRFGRFTIKEVR